MPSLTEADLVAIEAMANVPVRRHTFIETGTNVGETTLQMAHLFDIVETIEISAPLHAKAISRFSKEGAVGTKISAHLGDTERVLPGVVARQAQPVVMFLDAHFSHCDTGKSDKDVPLLEELDIIAAHLHPEALLIIDDLRLFDTTQFEDWKGITVPTCLERLSTRVSHSFAAGDRYVIILNAL